MNILDRRWLELVRKQHPKSFKGVKVLEIGSLDVNGSMWELFEECEMTGVDWIAGPHVTHVMQASQTDFPQQSFDVVMSFNHLEHDPFWEESLLHNLPSLKDGGLFILRWATHESGKHGPEFDPTHQGGYYPKTLEEVVTFLQSNGLKILERSKDINPYIGMMANIVARKKQEQNVE